MDACGVGHVASTLRPEMLLPYICRRACRSGFQGICFLLIRASCHGIAACPHWHGRVNNWSIGVAMELVWLVPGGVAAAAACAAAAAGGAGTREGEAVRHSRLNAGETEMVK